MQQDPHERTPFVQRTIVFKVPFWGFHVRLCGATRRAQKRAGFRVSTLGFGARALGLKEFIV